MSGINISVLRLTLARACAWGLLVAGWVGIGSIGLQLAPSLSYGFALVALWLLALGAAAAVATHGGMRPGTRALALCLGAIVTAAALWSAVNGGGLFALLIALFGWAVLTALASGVVRGLRRMQALVAAPPVAAAAIGALCAGLVLGDLGVPSVLAARLAAFVGTIAVTLVALQRGIDSRSYAGCRAGLFDCSLPAWPPGAWRDAVQWPTLLAGLAMLPMMAALPLTVALCRAAAIAPQVVVAMHLVAMFGPALALKPWIGRWSMRTLSAVCAVLLASGAAFAVWVAAPLDLLGVTVMQGAAWSLAWSGQLWAPARRGKQGASPLRAAVGYAALTLAFGLIVEHAGARGIGAVHGALGLAAVVAWVFTAAANLLSHTVAHRDLPPAVRPDRPGVASDS